MKKTNLRPKAMPKKDKVPMLLLSRKRRRMVLPQKKRRKKQPYPPARRQAIAKRKLPSQLIPGGGDCFFHSVLHVTQKLYEGKYDGLTGARLRAKPIVHETKQQDFFEVFFVGEDDPGDLRGLAFDQYASLMALKGS